MVGSLRATGRCSSVERLNWVFSLRQQAGRTELSLSTHTHRQKPPHEFGLSAGAGRSAGSSAQPTLQGLPQATSFQALEAGFPLWSYGLHPIRTAQLSAPFFCNSAVMSLPDSTSWGQVGRGPNGRETVGHCEAGRPSGVMPVSTSSRHNQLCLLNTLKAGDKLEALGSGFLTYNITGGNRSS